MVYSNKSYALSAVFAVAAFTNPAWAACLSGEETFMSCHMEASNRILRVCFTSDTVFYRYGARGQTPELALTTSVAEVDYFPWPGVGRSISEAVSFQNKGYRYDVFAGFERMFGDEEYEDIPHRSFGGVRVFEGDSLIAELQCDRQTVDFAWGEGLYTAKNNLGYVWDHQEREWVALPD